MKDNPKWKAMHPLSKSSKRMKVNESGYYIPSPDLATSLNVENGEVEVLPNNQMTRKAKPMSKGKSKENDKSLAGKMQEEAEEIRECMNIHLAKMQNAEGPLWLFITEL
ncbi:hypothetical protein Sjap_005916 [Stephania japonica]|uniref:Uncharacterized protein n=1 Tax=Stephania japonica TaxID=461633 RepID=A0AAP0K6G7_9MAGN